MRAGKRSYDGVSGEAPPQEWAECRVFSARQCKLSHLLE